MRSCVHCYLSRAWPSLVQHGQGANLSADLDAILAELGGDESGNAPDMLMDLLNAPEDPFEAGCKKCANAPE